MKEIIESEDEDEAETKKKIFRIIEKVGVNLSRKEDKYNEKNRKLEKRNEKTNISKVNKRR